MLGNNYETFKLERQKDLASKLYAYTPLFFFMKNTNTVWKLINTLLLLLHQFENDSLELDASLITHLRIRSRSIPPARSSSRERPNCRRETAKRDHA
jgi:hypothetical protein